MNGPLDRAWAEAEAALPHGWVIRELYRMPGGDEWLASAALERAGEAPPGFAEGFGNTPADALHALARTLGRGAASAGSAATQPEESLDPAWNEAEARLPRGWTIRELYRMRAEIWAAAATLLHSTEQPGDHAEAIGATPAAALRALALQLQLKPG